jgi:Raf kinase inhibitor-like YbhB/YbcL family protein
MEHNMAFELKSSAFGDGGTMPKQYSCDDRNISPPLHWKDPPDDTRQLSLIMDDPDAPRAPFTHWVIYNIPSTTNSLPEYVPNEDYGPDGSRQGLNSGGEIGYSGPCPPYGDAPHHYVFNLYALDVELDLPPRQDKAALLLAMGGHIIALTQLTGLYARRPPAEEPKGKARELASDELLLE